jgi:glycine/D-amino acid oxidase-like deaminating enzyme
MIKQNFKNYDAVIIGGGIFGSYAALTLLSKGLKVAMLEKENSVFKHASKINQSRIHRGYHYPRSIDTAKKGDLKNHPFRPGPSGSGLCRFSRGECARRRNAPTNRAWCEFRASGDPRSQAES